MRKAAAGIWLQRSLPWILPFGLIFGWYLISRWELIPNYLLPHPQQILVAGFDYILGDPLKGVYTGRFWGDFCASIGRVFLGFTLATAIGLPLGLLSGRLPSIQLMLGSTLNALRAVPGICWLPLALIWFGIGLKTTVFLVALAAFFPIFLNAEAGARQVNPTLTQAGTMLGMNRWRRVYRVLIPAAMPHIVTGLRLGMGISWAYLVLGELTGVPNGLGAVIMDARMLGRNDIIIVGIILIAMIGRLCDTGLHLLLRLFFKSARRLT